MKRSLKYVSALLIVLALIIVLPLLRSSVPGEGLGSRLALRPPAVFAQAAGMLDREAGLSAYLNIGPVEYSDIYDAAAQAADNGGRAMGTDGNGYVWVEVVIRHEDGSATSAVKANIYADINGWIVGFLVSGDRVSKLINWGTDPTSGAPNVLEEAIEKVLIELGRELPTGPGRVSYYHFQYPQATTIQWATDNDARSALTFAVPDELVVYDSGISLINPKTRNTSCGNICRENVRVAVDPGDDLAIPLERSSRFDAIVTFIAGTPHSIRALDIVDAGTQASECVTDCPRTGIVIVAGP